MCSVKGDERLLSPFCHMEEQLVHSGVIENHHPGGRTHFIIKGSVVSSKPIVDQRINSNPCRLRYLTKQRYFLVAQHCLKLKLSNIF